MVRAGYPDLQAQSVEAYDNLKAWLLASPLQLTEADISAYLGQAWEAIQRDSSALVSGLMSVGTTAGHVLAGFLLTLFATLFFLIDGKGVWRWIVGLFPRRSRPAVDGAGQAGWITSRPS